MEPFYPLWLYIVAAEEQGVKELLSGTIQNDILKVYGS
jgi:methylmalonyl-CoA mutase N-terminal domain/subunit